MNLTKAEVEIILQELRRAVQDIHRHAPADSLVAEKEANERLAIIRKLKAELGI